jgi:YD repeat protein
LRILGKITFEYGEDYIYTQKQRQETIYHLVDAVPARFASGMIHDLENYVYSFSKINQKVLKKIVTDLLTIEIITDNRLDIESVQTTKLPQKVSEIKIKDNSGLVVKNIIFDYEYVGLVSNYCSCRLFLKRVTDKAGEERHVYEFTYDRASKLPNKDSNAIDDWGYYNGKTISDRRWGTEQQQGGESNITYVPAYRLKTMSPLSGYTYDLSYLGRSREVVNEYVTCGMLSSMKYPTGLITNFEYEPHAVQNGSNSTLQKEQVVLGVAYYQNFLWDEDEDENMYENSKMAAFTLTKETEITLQWRVLTYDEEPKKDEDGEVSFYRCAFLKNESGKILKEISVVEREMGRFILQKLVLPAGKYTVNVATQNIITPGNYGMSLSVSMEVVKNIDTNVVSKGGGVRVKRIYSTFEGKIISDLKYGYMKKGKSTGLLMNSPVFTYPFTTRNLTLRGVYDIGGVRVDVIDVTGFYVCGMSYPYTPFSFSAMGASVGYSTVTVRENFCTGYEEYSYYNVPDRALSSDESYIPGFPTTGSLRNGQLLSKILYDDDGGKVEETNYIYTVDRQETVKGFKVYIPLIFSTFSTSEFDYIYARFYDTVSERWNLTREITTTYDPSNYGSNYGTPSVQFYKDYKYLSSNDLPSMVSYGNSDKSIRQIQYKYSTDYADQMSQKMRNRNLVNKPLETIYMCGGSVTKAEKTSYIDTLGLILPKIVYALKASSPLSLSMYSSFYRKKYSIDLYNKHGKIVQMSEKDNIPVTYLWGYKSIYPIAEIRNATYNEVAMHLRNIDSFENSLSPIMTSIENLRSLLKKSLITTYTYKVPWGIQKTVSPTGMNTTYNYDLFGRLQTILDHNGKVVKRLKYNYKQ